MSEPINFPESNTVLRGGPAARYGTPQDVLDLHTYRDGRQIISCWRLTWRERLQALIHGRVWVHVVSSFSAPPIGLTIARTAFLKPQRRKPTDDATISQTADAGDDGGRARGAEFGAHERRRPPAGVYDKR